MSDTNNNRYIDDNYYLLAYNILYWLGYKLIKLLKVEYEDKIKIST